MSHKDLTPQQSELYIFVEEFKKLQGEFFEKFGDEDITDRQTRTMPLSIIPELTEELYKKAINWSALSESTKKLRTDNGASASDEELADGLIDTRMNSIIELGSDADFRKGTWNIGFDGGFGLYWKTKSSCLEDIELDIWVNYVQND